MVHIVHQRLKLKKTMRPTSLCYHPRRWITVMGLEAAWGQAQSIRMWAFGEVLASRCDLEVLGGAGSASGPERLSLGL